MEDASPTEGFSWRKALSNMGNSLGIGAAVLLGAGALLLGLGTGLTGIAVIEAENRKADERIYVVANMVAPKNPVICFEFPHAGATSPESSRVGVILPSGDRARVLINHGKGGLTCPETYFALQVEHMTPK